MNINNEAKLVEDVLEDVVSEELGPDLDNTEDDTGFSDKDYIGEAVRKTTVSIEMPGELINEAGSDLYSAVQRGRDPEEVFQEYGERWFDAVIREEDNALEVHRNIQPENLYREVANNVVSRDNTMKSMLSRLKPGNIKEEVKDMKNFLNPQEMNFYRDIDADIDGYTPEELQEAAEQGYETALARNSDYSIGEAGYGDWDDSRDANGESGVPKFASD